MAAEMVEKTIYVIKLRNQGGNWEDNDHPHFMVIAENEDTAREIVFGRAQYSVARLPYNRGKNNDEMEDNEIEDIEPMATGIMSVPNGVKYITSSLD